MRSAAGGADRRRADALRPPLILATQARLERSSSVQFALHGLRKRGGDCTKVYRACAVRSETPFKVATPAADVNGAESNSMWTARQRKEMAK